MGVRSALDAAHSVVRVSPYRIPHRQGPTSYTESIISLCRDERAARPIWLLQRWLSDLMRDDDIAAAFKYDIKRIYDCFSTPLPFHSFHCSHAATPPNLTYSFSSVATSRPWLKRCPRDCYHRKRSRRYRSQTRGDRMGHSDGRMAYENITGRYPRPEASIILRIISKPMSLSTDMDRHAHVHSIPKVCKYS